METAELISDFIGRFLTTHDGGFLYCSLSFFITLLIFYAIYIVTRLQRKEVMQLYVVAFSLFYAYKANGLFMLLLPATTLISWWITYKMKKENNRRLRKMLATLGVLIVLAPLVFFKYTNFTLETLNNIIASNFSPVEIFLPIGLSFYTFQAISYIVDVYKGKFLVHTSLLEYTFYLTFFPLLIAGPITRPSTLIPQLKKSPPVDKNLIYGGLFLIICGILKKGLIADYISQYNNWIFQDPQAFSGFEVWMGILGYTIQIYCDFSGYCDISIGIAALMGFRLLPNFNCPYRALNLTEFWRRWHIALSTWFRDYIYIPLGGNRKGKARTYINNFITMLFAGWWHGASLMFIIWGGLHGLGLIIQKSSHTLMRKIGDGIGILFFSWLLTFLFVMFTWIFFRAENLENAFQVYGKMFGDFDCEYIVPFIKARPIWLILVVSSLILHLIIDEDVFGWFRDKFIKISWLFKMIIFLISVQLVINFSMENIQPFIYSQF